MYTKCRFTNKKLLKPGLKLIGAKSRPRDILYQLMPEHEVYIEPFAGSTTVVTGKAPSPVEIIGDTNPYLINYIDVLKVWPDYFWKHLPLQLGRLKIEGKDRFLEIRDQVTLEEDKELQAVWFYLITKSCYNGIWRISEKTGLCNSSFCGDTKTRGWFTKDWFDAVVERYKNMQAHNWSYQRTMVQVLSHPGKEALCFLDPPYRHQASGGDTVTTYNGQKFLDKDFEELKENMDVFPGKVLMTINDDEWTRRLFSGYCIVPHQIQYNCSQTPKGRGPHPELLVANYDIETRFKELKSQIEDAKAETKSRKGRAVKLGDSLDTMET